MQEINIEIIGEGTKVEEGKRWRNCEREIEIMMETGDI